MQLCWAALPLAALLLPSSAAADPGGSSVDLILKGSIAPRCEFRDAPAELTLFPKIGSTEPSAASQPMGFSCNLPEATSLSLTITSANGALMREDDPQGLGYSLDWRVGGTMPVSAFAPTTEATVFQIDAGQPGAATAGELTIRLNDPAAIIRAGDYSDQITFNLSP